ncbi:MAG: hypothetical protein ACE366_02830 [Bradymonadia bacterium]
MKTISIMCALLALWGCDDGGDESSPGGAGGMGGVAGGGSGGGGSGGTSMMPDAAMGSIELGTGFRSFESLEDGQEVPIIAGIQGGFHIWGAIRGEHFDGSEVRMLFELVQDGEVVGGANYIDFITPDDDGIYEYPAVAVVFDEANPNLYEDKPTLMRVQLTDAEGQVLTDEITLDPFCCE